MAKLKCPLGVEVLSHGDQSYFADSAGMVNVREEDVPHFCNPPHNCVVVEEPPAPQPGKPEKSKPVAVEQSPAQL